MIIISQNCNGITKQSNYYNLQLELNNLLETEFDFIMLQETNLNWKNRGALRNIQKTIRHITSALISMSTNITFDKNSLFKYGGTATIFRITSSKIHTIINTDNTGRWNIDKITIGNSEIYLINIYRPCKSNNGNLSVWQ